MASEEHEEKGRTEWEGHHVSWRKLADVCQCMKHVDKRERNDDMEKIGTD